MIQSIDIERFGSFSRFTWKTTVLDSKGNQQPFKRLNILYGRNYSGKTTLSRLVRTLETGQLPLHFEDANFSLQTDQGTITQDKIANYPQRVRVFNRDFIRENLSFLHDENGHIEPFAILGSDNTRIQKEIVDLETELGSLDPPTGLRNTMAQAREKLEEQQKQFQTASDKRSRQLKEKAQSLKNDLLLAVVTYNVRSIQEDLDRIAHEQIAPISAETEANLRAVLEQNHLPPISEQISFAPTLTQLLKTAEDLFARVIRPTEEIADLIHDEILQDWVSRGLQHHRDKRHTCAFCGCPLTSQTWQRLDKHFNRESEQLKQDLKILQSEARSELKKLNDLPNLLPSQFYPQLRSEFDSLQEDLSRQTKQYEQALQELEAAVKSRIQNPFQGTATHLPADNSHQLRELLDRLAALISKHSQTSDSLDEEKKPRRVELRLGYVARLEVVGANGASG